MTIIIFYVSYILAQNNVDTNLINELGIGLNNTNRIIVNNNYAYISVSDPVCGLYVVDITNTDSLWIAGYLSLPSCGIDDLVYKDGFIYTGNSIVNVNIPENPVFVGDLGLPQTNYHFSKLNGDTLFVIIESQLWIIDITSPDNPNTISVFWGDYIYGEFAIYADFVYLCSDNGLDIVDISNISEPTLIGNINVEYLSYSNSDIIIFDNYALIVSGDRLNIYSLSNPQFPGLITTLNGGGYGPITLNGNYVYTFGGSSISNINIINISEIETPNVVANYPVQFGNWNAVPLDYFISQNKLYCVGYKVGVEIVDITNPMEPIYAGSLIRGNIKEIAKKDNLVYLLTPYEIGGSSSYYDNRIQVVDISDPLNPTYHENIFTNSSGTSMVLFEDYLGVLTNSSESSGFEIIDITNSYSPQLISNIVLQGYSPEVNIMNDKAFILTNSAENRQVKIIDISDVANPINISNYMIDSGVLYDIAIDSTILAIEYFYNNSIFIQIVDISNLPSTTYLTTISPSVGEINQLKNTMILINKKLYLGFNNGIKVYNLSNPQNPEFIQFFGINDFPSFNWNNNFILYGSGELFSIDTTGLLA